MAQQPIAIGSQSFYRGETVRWVLPIQLPNGSAKDLTGAALRWGLVKIGGALIIPEKALASGIVHEAGDPTLGRPIVSILEAESETIPASTYFQEWHITDALGDVQVYRGAVSVNNSVLWATG